MGKGNFFSRFRHAKKRYRLCRFPDIEDSRMVFFAVYVYSLDTNLWSCSPFFSKGHIYILLSSLNTFQSNLLAFSSSVPICGSGNGKRDSPYTGLFLLCPLYSPSPTTRKKAMGSLAGWVVPCKCKGWEQGHGTTLTEDSVTLFLTYSAESFLKTMPCNIYYLQAFVLVLLTR